MLPAPLPQAQIGGHRLLRPLGQGSTGTVMLAVAPDGSQVVALKLLRLPPADAREGAVRQFNLAASAAMRLRHPDIVQVHGHGIDGDWAWVSMEPVPGSDLSRYANPARLLPVQLVLRIGARMARALAHAHGQGIVHRDIKPANILADWAGDQIKLADFGLARGAWASTTGTGVVPGSPAYMSPEQLAGGVPGPASDLYSLGVTLFELLAGRRPHEADRMGELLRQVAQEAAPALGPLVPGLPPDAAACIAQMLSKTAQGRPASAEAVADSLLTAADGLGPPV